MDLLANAVTARREVRFEYDGHPRVVQGARLGVHYTTGSIFLRGYQIGGSSSSDKPPFWRIFSVDKIKDLEVTDVVFTDDPPGHTASDAHMARVIAEI